MEEERLTALDNSYPADHAIVHFLESAPELGQLGCGTRTRRKLLLHEVSRVGAIGEDSPNSTDSIRARTQSLNSSRAKQ